MSAREDDKPMDPISVVFEADAQRSAAYKDGELIGECKFTLMHGKWAITHTGVRPAYGGQGIARRLVISVIEAARSNQVKILPICSYAKKLMEGKDEFKDVL